MSQHSRIRTAAKWGAVPVSILVSGLLVWQSSYSAFSSTTSNPTSNWTTGTVALTDDDAGSALFTASALKPGSTGTKCIVVTSSGSLASAVKLYGTTYSTTNALGSYVNLVVDEGTGGTFSTSGPTSCTGFSSGGNDFTGTLAAFAAAKTGFGNGVSSWAPTGSGSESKTFRITYTIDAATPNSAQGGTAAVGFTWEAQNS
jgi:hypothetical protein